MCTACLRALSALCIAGPYLDGESVHKMMEDYQVTHTAGVPTVGGGWGPSWAGLVLSCLLYCLDVIACLTGSHADLLEEVLPPLLRLHALRYWLPAPAGIAPRGSKTPCTEHPPLL